METEPAARSLSFEEYLEHLVEHELPKRGSRAVERRIKAAGFPAIYRLEEYDSKRMPKSTRSFSSSFIAPTGSAAGRTWSRAASTGSGRRILRSRTVSRPPEKDYEVRFRKADQLVLELLEPRDEAQVLKLRAKLRRADFLVVDELAIFLLGRADGEPLHGVLSERYDARKSVLVTTNLEFGRWVEVFQSKEMTVALLDRLTHRSDVVVMTGRSKREEESLEREMRRRARQGKEVVKA